MFHRNIGLVEIMFSLFSFHRIDWWYIVQLRENNTFAAPINNIGLHTVMFSLHFE